ncbi:MAG: Sec-independent protein translocase protein TatB [Pseudomonadota bacterium]
MGGLGPGIGGLEYLVIGIVALVVVGPERLPGMLRQLGKMVAKARGMANEFRSSFDEMARQSELDDLRKEVEALRTGQGSVGQNMVRLGDEANAAFKDIKTELEKSDAVDTAQAAVVLNQPEFPEPVMTPLADTPAKVRKSPAKAKPEAPATATTKAPPTKAATPKRAPAKAKAEPKKPAKPRAPRNSKLDL